MNEDYENGRKYVFLALHFTESCDESCDDENGEGDEGGQGGCGVDVVLEGADDGHKPAISKNIYLGP